MTDEQPPEPEPRRSDVDGERDELVADGGAPADDLEDGEYETAADEHESALDDEVDLADEEMERLLAEFDALEETVDTPAERERVRTARRAAVSAAADAPVFGRIIRGFDRGDLAEAFLGSVLFGVPMFVEGGTNEVGEFVAAHPVSLAGTFLAGIGLVIGILYVAEIQDVRVHDPFFGVVPRRLVGVLGVSFVTALVVMTGWGRVDWADPVLAISTVVVAFVPMSVGAALGDILPGT